MLGEHLIAVLLVFWQASVLEIENRMKNPNSLAESPMMPDRLELKARASLAHQDLLKSIEHDSSSSRDPPEQFSVTEQARQELFGYHYYHWGTNE